MAAVGVTAHKDYRPSNGELLGVEVTLAAGTDLDTISVKAKLNGIKQVVSVWRECTAEFDQSGDTITLDNDTAAGQYRFEGRP